MRGSGVVASLLAVGLLACESSDTPWKYEICDRAGNGCFVSARFKDYESCDEYRTQGQMLCDRSTPGKVSCSVPPPTYEALGTSRCTK